MENNADRFANSRVVIIRTKDEKDLEDQPHIDVYSEYCKTLLESNESLLLCLHCGEPISEDQAPMVEIDQEGEEHRLGLVHQGCLNAIDRVLGVLDSELFRENRLIRNFDYAAWFQAAKRGQGWLGALDQGRNQVIRVAWKPDYHQVSKGAWCVKIGLEDGSARYVRDRGRVVRYSQEEASEVATDLNRSFEIGHREQDPWCYTSVNEYFGTYAVAVKMVAEDEDCLLCVQADAVRYSKAIGTTYSKFENYYTPLAILLDAVSGQPIAMEGTIPMITNPLKIHRYIKNWQRAGMELPEFVLSIIDSDDQFDKFVAKVKADGVTVAIDPRFDMNGHLCSGFVIEISMSYGLHKK